MDVQLKTRYLNSGFCTLKMKAFEQLSKVVILGATKLLNICGIQRQRMLRNLENPQL